jgi:hypothetical protein
LTFGKEMRLKLIIFSAAVIFVALGVALHLCSRRSRVDFTASVKDVFPIGLPEQVTSNAPLHVEALKLSAAREPASGRPHIIDSREDALARLEKWLVRNSSESRGVQYPKIKFLIEEDLAPPGREYYSHVRRTLAEKGRKMVLFRVEGGDGLHTFELPLQHIVPIPPDIRVHLTDEDMAKFQYRMLYAEVERAVIRSRDTGK